MTGCAVDQPLTAERGDNVAFGVASGMTMRWCAQRTEVRHGDIGAHRRPTLAQSGKDQMHRKLFAAPAGGVVMLAASAAPAVSVTINGRRILSGAGIR